MNTEYGSWRDYQEAVAGVFRRLGCSAEVDKTVTGARGPHNIDVYVTFKKFGQECRWIIECKQLSRPADKSVVQTLQSIVQNIGADRGLIFSESGFQSGAYTASQNTNILLQDSLEDFRRTAHLHLSRIPLLPIESDEPDTSPVHAFPDNYKPNHLLRHNGRLFVSNWGRTSGREHCDRQPGGPSDRGHHRTGQVRADPSNRRTTNSSTTPTRQHRLHGRQAVRRASIFRVRSRH